MFQFPMLIPIGRGHYFRDHPRRIHSLSDVGRQSTQFAGCCRRAASEPYGPSVNTPGLGFAEFLLVMAERCEHGPVHPDHVVDCLQQIDEAFGRKLDPTIEFEAYAAWRFCHAIRRVLEASTGVVQLRH